MAAVAQPPAARPLPPDMDLDLEYDLDTSELDAMMEVDEEA